MGKLRKTYEKVIFLGDIHFPYQDNKALELLDEFLDWFKPDVIYLIGDICDFYALSTFDRDPSRLLSLQDELNAAKDWFAKLRKRCPKAKIHFRSGNHEFRLLRYLWRRPELSPLEALTIPALLDFERFKIVNHDYNCHLDHRGFQVEHGDMVRKHSAYTASGMLEKRQLSGISGHTHRAGMHFRTDAYGVKVWIENGCLCRLNPEYIIGKPNWQSAFTVGYWLVDDDRFTLEIIPIVKHRIFYQGRIWRLSEGGVQ